MVLQYCHDYVTSDQLYVSWESSPLSEDQLDLDLKDRINGRDPLLLQVTASRAIEQGLTVIQRCHNPVNNRDLYGKVSPTTSLSDAES